MVVVLVATQTDWLFGTLGVFILAGTLLGLSGITGSTIEIPDGVSEPVSSGNPQGWLAGFTECLLTLPILGIDGFNVGADCKRETRTAAFGVVSELLAFGVSYASFFFQLLTFQLPIPAVLNAMIVVPPAIANVYIGLRLGRGGG